MKRAFSKKTVALLVSLALLACVAVGSTIAWITAKTNAVTNEFAPGVVTTWVSEENVGTTKQNVKIQNTGNVNAYIRAAVVVNWAREVTEDGVTTLEISGTPVKNSDYDISAPESGWVKGADGYYYWTQPVSPGKYTGILIPSLTQAVGVTPPEGYFLNVEILGSGIQSLPTSVVEAEWSNDYVTVGVVGTTLTVTAKQGGG